MEMEIATHVYNQKTDHMCIGVRVYGVNNQDKIIQIGIPNWTENKRRIDNILYTGKISEDDYVGA